MSTDTDSLAIVQTESIGYIKNQLNKNDQIERQAEWLYRLLLTIVATTTAAVGLFSSITISNDQGFISGIIYPLLSRFLPIEITSIIFVILVVIFAIVIYMLLSYILVNLIGLPLSAIGVLTAVDAKNLLIVGRSERIVPALGNSSVFTNQNQTRLSFGPGPRDINNIVSNSTNRQAACDQIAHKYQRTINNNNDILREKDKQLAKAKQNLGLVTIYVLTTVFIIMFVFFYA